MLEIDVFECKDIPKYNILKVEGPDFHKFLCLGKLIPKPEGGYRLEGIDLLTDASTDYDMNMDFQEGCKIWALFENGMLRKIFEKLSQ